jgi:hypothetical protein
LVVLLVGIAYEVVFHIDRRKHSKMVPFECFFCGSHHIAKSHVYSLGEMVGHLRLLFSSPPPFSIPDPMREAPGQGTAKLDRVSDKLSNNSAANLTQIKSVVPCGL